jgi:hypothetical protein
MFISNSFIVHHLQLKRSSRRFFVWWAYGNFHGICHESFHELGPQRGINRIRNPHYCHVHFQEVCSHWELKQYEATHFQYHFTLFFIWIQYIKPLTSKIILAIWRKKLHIFPHLHPNLLAPSFIWLPSICNCYASILQWQNENLQKWSHQTPWKLWLNTHNLKRIR